MKKYILALVMAVSMTAGVAAQATLHIRWPLPHYFSYVWPQSYYDSVDIFRTGISFRGSNKYATDIAYYMFTEDTLTIYGVAAGLISEKDHHGSIYERVLDTSYKDVYDYLCIYEAGNGEITPLREVRAHMHDTPISYYWDFDAYQRTGNMYMQPIVPMYECYFTNPVDVIDSFYVGRHYHAHRQVESNSQGYTATTMEIFHASTYPFFLATNDSSIYQPYVMGWINRDDTSSVDWNYCTAPPYTYEQVRQIPLMFPILEPGRPINDTTVIGSDTTAMGDTLIVYDTLIVNGDTIVVADTLLTVMQPDLLQRVTSVTPNPARGTARVVASTGLTMVEAYSMACRKVHSQRVPQGTLSVTLDVSRWPAGTYLLRIHTPLGATIKKLTVTR